MRDAAHGQRQGECEEQRHRQLQPRYFASPTEAAGSQSKLKSPKMAAQFASWLGCQILNDQAGSVLKNAMPGVKIGGVRQATVRQAFSR